MRIKSNNKFISRLLAKIFGIRGYEVEFIFVRELYDDELTELAFLRQSLDMFEEQADEFREKMKEAMENASKE